MDLESKNILLAVIHAARENGNSYIQVGMGVPGAVYLDVANRLEKLTTSPYPSVRMAQKLFQEPVYIHGEEDW